MTRPLTLCLAFLPLVSCVDSRYQPCDEISWLCPAGTVCDVVNNVCSERSEQCLYQADGEECTVGGGAGVCTRGTCQVLPGPRCQDGIRDEDEDCDGDDLNGANCRTVAQSYYYEPGLRCDENCRFDTETCTGYCGDGIKDDDFEFCDPYVPDPDGTSVGFCATLGFGAGYLGCRPTCDGPTTDACIRFGWVSSSPTSGSPDLGSISGIWGADGQLIAIGSSRKKLRWFDGKTWHDWPGGDPVESGLPSLDIPAAIWGASLNDFWIASGSGLTHWDGIGWSFTAYPNGILAMWGSADDDIFGVGSGGIHHYNGNSWSETATPGDATFFDVSGTGPKDVYAVGLTAAPFSSIVLHFDGTAWSPVDIDTVGYVRSVWASAPDDVWFIDYSSSPAVLHFDGAEWQRWPLPVEDAYRVAGRGPNDVWVAGSTTALHFDGVGWVKTRLDPTITQGHIQRMWVDRLSVAVFTSDTVGVWAGTGQLDYLGSPPTNAFWRDVWGVNSAAWVAVGDASDYTSGIAYHGYDGSVWVLPEVLTLVAGFGRDDVYATGEAGSIYHFDGASWTVLREPQVGHRPQFIQAVGTSSLYVLESVDPGYVLSRFDGSEWSIIPTPDDLSAYGEPVLAMWVFSSDDIWLFGGPFIWHFDGNEWLLTDLGGEGLDFIRSAWGSAPDDLYALEPPRAVWHYDGTTWTVMQVGLESSVFYFLGGHAADDLFVLGTTGDIAHFDGRLWEPMARLDLRIETGVAIMPGILVSVGVSSSSLERSAIEGFLRTRLWHCRTCERDPGNRIDDDCDGHVDELDIGCQRWEP